MKLETPSFKEDHISQIPTLQLLQNLGYVYLPPAEVEKLRGGKLSNVILDGVLEAQLRRLNKIQYKGEEFDFTEGNIQTAIQALKGILFDGLVRTNEKVYDLLCLGKSLPQSIYGDLKSFSLKYIDWEHPENNVFHVAEEFPVERSGSHETRRPDIVLFVNGIPLGVIECKRPDIKNPIEEAVSQQIRNQKEDEIPRLFVYSQLLLALSKNEAKYATTGTPAKFWSVWKEEAGIEEPLSELVNKPLPDDSKDRLFTERFRYVRRYFDAIEDGGGREVTEQDRAIYSLCRPDRLLELAFRYIVFDAGDKKVARYQQYFCVKKSLDRITTFDPDGVRQGGVIWHTQGSGKSLTMVMLAKSISLLPEIDNHKIILVTDRVDLDDQIYNTFRHCGKDLVQAKTGNHLLELIGGQQERIITTVIDKFEASLKKKDFKNEDKNIFVLVDESHRSQYGEIHALMRKVLPAACFIGFTGTPVIKKQKNTIQKFGGLIDTYTIDQAVQDKAVVPLLYEGRDVQLYVDRQAIDQWFEKVTANLSKDQKADLKKKFTTTDQINKADQKIKAIAWDVGHHFKTFFDNERKLFKAQFVADSKISALKFKKYFDEFETVRAEVLISGPDDREGNYNIYEANKQPVIEFWKKMMDKYGTEKEYNKQLINSFKKGDDPEIIIVVDKLLVGFDAPRNAVLYVYKSLKEHTLLQAIARVNRLSEGKDHGYIIDYYGVLGKLDEAFDLYRNLSEYDKEDLAHALEDITQYADKLPQKHSDLKDIFKGIKNKLDEEEYEQLLADKPLRDKFSDRLSDFARTLQLALSTAHFLETTPEEKIRKYKDDLKFFMNLRTSVRRRYAEEIDFGEYEPKIQKLLDSHLGAGEVESLTPLTNIFNEQEFKQEVEKQRSTASKADTIAHRTKRTLSEEWKDKDPAFYRKFSKLIEEAIKAFREKRISDLEYLNTVSGYQKAVQNHIDEEVPETLKNQEIAQAFYGIFKEVLEEHAENEAVLSGLGAEASLGIDEIIQKNRIVNWHVNEDVQNMIRNKIEDFLFELQEKKDIQLSFEEIDEIMEQCIDIAKVRCR